MEYLFEVVVVGPHFVLALLLIFGGLAVDLLCAMINFICSQRVAWRVRPQLEVVSSQLLQLLVI